MRFSKAVYFLLVLAFLAGGRVAARAEETPAPATVKSLCDALLTSMKRGPAIDFAARKDLLAPEIQRDFDLAFMTRIVTGPTWQNLAAADRQKLVDAFSAFSIATYAQQFASYSGERFEVDSTPASLPDGDCIVHTKLFTSDPQPVQLDYRLRKSGDHWLIIDVYLNGTISQLAARRSEYSTILRQGGAPALIDLLTKKAAELGNQRAGSS